MPGEPAAGPRRRRHRAQPGQHDGHDLEPADADSNSHRYIYGDRDGHADADYDANLNIDIDIDCNVYADPRGHVYGYANTNAAAGGAAGRDGHLHPRHTRGHAHVGHAAIHARAGADARAVW